ncbi:hypothetical protein E9531_15805 [Lampropedia puyangensis]|uniref:Yip1 domain-containing protein n=1 Tax=Lampropedia puyangensis TaxID=1330072 RepID=A0A4S8ET99_9BURK|nr:YIP1 family protein [Lampropedia puyangensis]THT97598.1 hypothetical protein E9531_15805 [Lampropedia puyangensis]
MPTHSPFDLKRIAQLALYVVVRPVEYFRTMPRQGSLMEPLAFAIVLAIVVTLISAMLTWVGGALGLIPAQVGINLLDLLVFVPGMIVSASVIGAAILLLVWKVLGSQWGYGVAFRCTVATLAVSPITTVFALIPVVGLWVNVIWTMYLLVVASTEVHGISRKKAVIAFTVMGGLIAASSAFMNASQSMFEEQLQQLGVSPAEFSSMSRDQQQQTVERIRKNMGQ